MPILKDQKKEGFAQKWHETGNKSEAYRYSHPASKNWKDKTVHNRACELASERDVLGRYEELQRESADNHGITVKSLLDELEEARMTALTAETPQSSAAVSATMGKAKLCGLDKQIIEHSGVIANVNIDKDTDPQDAAKAYQELMGK